MDRAAVTPEEAAALLRRAAELQAADLGREDALDADAVVRLGRELGLREDAVRTALAEHRRPRAAAVAPVVLGLDAQVVVERHLGADPRAVQSHVGRWLGAQWMNRQRSSATVTTWRPRRGTLADLRRGFDLLGTLELKGVGVVQVTTVPEGCGSQVCVAVSVSGTRAEALGGLVALPAGVVAGASVLVSLAAGAPEALLGLPLAAVAGAGGWLGARAVVATRRRQVAEAVEGVLDELADD